MYFSDFEEKEEVSLFIKYVRNPNLEVKWEQNH